MAEAAGEAQAKKSRGGREPFAEVAEMLFVLLVVVAFLELVFRALKSGVGALGSLKEFVLSIWPSVAGFLMLVSTLVSLLLLTGIIYSVIRLTQINREVSERYKEAEKTPAGAGSIVAAPVNPKWQRVVSHLDSENPGDWRLAILEADIMLDEMLQRMGYRGESVGDKLKTIEESDFTSINEAWEAHKVRNQIAHRGSDFLITQREARRVADLYKRVFEEFRYI